MLEGSSRRSRRAFIWVTTGLALLVVATCFGLSDDVLTGAVAATRYSARFSGLVLAAALVARGPRPVGWSMRRTELTLAFVAAHGVHYATVVFRALVEPGNKLRSFTIDAVVIVLLGLGLLTLVAATARRTSVPGRRTHAVAFYVAWTALTLASAVRARVSSVSAVVLAVLIAAMLWRVASGLVQRSIVPTVRT
jgi:hypothetical protein